MKKNSEYNFNSNQINDIANFVIQSFERMSLNIDHYFRNPETHELFFDRLREKPVTPSVFDNFVITAANALGISYTEVVLCDDLRIQQYEKEYATYFQLLKEYFQALEDEAARRYKESELESYQTLYEKVMYTVTESDSQLYKDIRSDFDEILDMEVHRYFYFHFDKMPMLIAAIEDLIRRAQELFEAILLDANGDTYANVEKEYNFLVSQLGLYDKYCSSQRYLYSDSLHYMHSIYTKLPQPFKTEVEIGIATELKPWACVEFIQNKLLVEKFATMIPNCVRELKQYPAWSLKNQVIVRCKVEDEIIPQIVRLDKSENELLEDRKYAMDLIEVSSKLPDQPVLNYREHFVDCVSRLENCQHVNIYNRIAD